MIIRKELLKKTTSIFLFILLAIIDCLAIGFIIYLTLPIAQWYLNAVPARGIDLWLSATQVSKLLSDLVLPFQKWRDYAYGGDPNFATYPFVYFYAMLPFASAYGLIKGVQLFAVFGLILFAGFSYLLYCQLSKNRILAVLLTLLTLYSANLYRALFWAGGIPFWTSQAFYPIVILFVVLFCQKNNYKWLYLSAVAAGIGMMGHPQGFLNLILPASVALLIFWREKDKISIITRLFDLLKFGLVTYLVSLPVVAHLYTPASFIAILIMVITKPLESVSPSSTGGAAIEPGTAGGISPEVIEWTKNQFKIIFTDTNPLLWYLLCAGLVLFALSLIFRKKRLKVLVSLLPFCFIVFYVTATIFLLSRGIDIFIGGWYKAFWMILPAVATLIAFCWGQSWKIFKERDFFKKKGMTVFKWVLVVVLDLGLVCLGYLFWVSAEAPLLRKFEVIDNLSSAFPDILNLSQTDQELGQLAKQLRPGIMIDDPHDYRLYVIDATVNIWWPGLQEVPLTRGYIDPSLTAQQRGSIFWLDSALGPSGKSQTSSLIEDWHTPVDVADSNLAFLLDWSATKYLEGNHISANNSFFSLNAIGDDFIEDQEKVTVQGGIMERYLPGEKWTDQISQDLNFYRVRADLVTPIMMASNAAPVLFVGDSEGYDILTRFLGFLNLGPRQIALVRGPKYLDEVSPNDLTKFEALIIYKYDYKNKDKAWRLIGKYLEKGGKVFIDTGPEGRDSETTKYGLELPGAFPIKNTTRGDLGKDWVYWYADDPTTKGIKFNKFTKLDFDGDVWNISHPQDTDDIRGDAVVILKQNNMPIVVKSTYGSGKIIWSGFNLPYHLIRDYNWQEAYFFRNILSELVDLQGGQVEMETTWITPELRLAQVPEAKGILLKENAYKGWKAEINGRKVEIYKAGPSWPGYIYVRLSPADYGGELKLRYHGEPMDKIYFAVSILTMLLVLDYLLGQRFIAHPLKNHLFKPLSRMTKKWWGKEDDY